jgi:PAS domain S-box-containing protein
VSELDLVPCGIASFDDDGTLLSVNTAFCDLLGYPAEELLGMHVQKVLTPGSRVFYSTHLFPLLKLYGVADEIYLALRSKDGRDVPVLLNSRRREGVTTCAFLRTLLRDRYEDELLAARRVAEQANAAKAKFLSMMSHDLRTPLTTIHGHAGLLTANVYGALTPEQREAMERIQGAVEVLMRMIGDILSFARLESGKVSIHPRPVAVAEAVARAEALLRLRFEEEDLAFASDGCEATVLADPDRLQQILLNLLTNAIKFTPRGGRISAECERDGERVRVHVRDSGIGIAPEQIGRVFDPFVQLGEQSNDTARRGVGLGLAISRDLAHAMGGEITVKSVPGEGSTFTIELPSA